MKLMFVQINALFARVMPFGWWQLAVAWIVVLTAYRLLLINMPYLSLFFDEAYYYHWAQNPDFGYYSKPPMVAWLIYLATFFMGVSQFAVKFFSPLCYGLTAWLIFCITKNLTNSKAAFYAVIVFTTAPLIAFNSVFMTTDAPLFLCWALSLFWALKFESKPCLSHAIVLGICLGLGMLSKYTFAVLPLGLLAYIITSRAALLRRVYLWLAIGIGLSLFTVNVVWNLEHGFVAAQHTQDIAKLSGPLINVLSFLTFLVTQFVILGLVSAFVLFVKFKKLPTSFKSVDAFKLLLWAMLPILLVIAIQALLSRAFANWAGPFIVVASILTGVAMSLSHKRFLQFGILLNIAVMLAFYHWPMVLKGLDIEPSKKNSPYSRVAAWPELALSIKSQIGEDVIVLSNSRELLAYMGFYLGVHADQLVYWNPDRHIIKNQYDLMNNLDDNRALFDKPLILIARPGDGEAIIQYFKHVELLGEHQSRVSTDLVRQVQVYRVRGFNGY